MKLGWILFYLAVIAGVWCLGQPVGPPKSVEQSGVPEKGAPMEWKYLDQKTRYSLPWVTRSESMDLESLPEALRKNLIPEGALSIQIIRHFHEGKDASFSIQFKSAQLVTSLVEHFQNIPLQPSNAGQWFSHLMMTGQASAALELEAPGYGVRVKLVADGQSGSRAQVDAVSTGSAKTHP